MLLIHGHLDGAVDGRIVARSARALAPGSEFVVVDGAGHFPHLDRPGEVLAAVENYVSS